MGSLFCINLNFEILVKDMHPSRADFNRILYLIVLNNQVRFSADVSKNIAYKILAMKDDILSVSIIDTKGNILATASKDAFKEDFGIASEGDSYGGSLAIAALAVANEVKDVAGEAQALITVYKRCKMMLLPIRSHEVLVGFVLRLPANIEDYYKLVDQVEFLLTDTTASLA